MAGVFGSKVREPKLIRRSGLHLDEQTPYATDLAQAWTSFGEAKTVLQRLEQASGSPPVKDRTTRRTKPHHVHFDSQRGSRGERSTQQHGHTTTSFANGQSFESVPGSDGREGKENEYIVEPKALNELGTRGSREFETRGTSSDGAYGSPLRDGSGKVTSASYRPGRSLSATHTLTGKVPTEQPASQSYDSSVRFTVPPSSSSLHPSPPSHSYAHTLTTTTTTTSHRHHITTASPSNPNSAGSSYPRLATTTAPYSNRAAVFGPPVRFGEDARQPTMVQPVDKSYLEKSLDNYTWLVDYCDRHREEAEKAFAQELPMCKEMVELLPLKIAAVA